jgi:hypothetical protein
MCATALQSSIEPGVRAMSFNSDCRCLPGVCWPMNVSKATAAEPQSSEGPLVYALEGVDHGGSVSNLVLPLDAPLAVRPGLSLAACT